MARLVRADPETDPGFTRVRSGRGYRYLDAHGKNVSKASLARIRTLAIPPAWLDVWIAADPTAHIQAVGTDTAGRKQYIYHRRWRQRRDRDKFTRALALAEALPRSRAYVTTTLRRGGFDREWALAVAFRLLDEAAPRIGSAQYLARHGSRGLTTLRRRDVSISHSRVVLSFRGKGGKQAHLEIDDADLAQALSSLKVGRDRSALLWYREGRRQVPLTASDVNRSIRILTGGSFTAKDFRTLRGTIVAAETLAQTGAADTSVERRQAEKRAIEAAANALGNTPTVARASYIDPRVFQRYARKQLLNLTITRESAIRQLLETR